MQSSLHTDPQEESNTDLINHFKNQAQLFMNAFADQIKGTLATAQFITNEIERLRIQKSMPDVAKEFILDTIAFNEARLPPLDAKLKRAERIKEKLNE